MSDAEKQEGQKTVVAFITGLLIGGLLVWVFSSTPDSAPQTENEEVTTEESGTTDQNTEDTTDTTTENGSNVSTNGTGSLTVNNQAAGDTVTLGATTYPSTDGWIVVRDYTDNVLGKILGAARYSSEEGLTPTSVSLLRNTEKGKTYQVMFYTESGDKKFSTSNDTVVEGGSATFKAE